MIDLKSLVADLLLVSVWADSPQINIEDAIWADSDRLCAKLTPNTRFTEHSGITKSALESQRLLWNHKSPQLRIQDFVEGGGVICQIERRRSCSRQEISDVEGWYMSMGMGNGRKMKIK